MRARTTIRASVAACLLIAAGVAAWAWIPTAVYEDGFDKGIRFWEPFLGYWRLNDKQWHWQDWGGNGGGCLRHECELGVKEPGRGAHDAMIIYRSKQPWTNFSFEADARSRKGNFGLWFRARMRRSDAKDGRYVAGYYLSLDPAHKRATLWMARKDGYDSAGRWDTNHFSNPVSIADGQIPQIPPDTWVRLKVVAIGPRLEGYVDGQKIFDVTDDTYSYGSIGFFTYKSPDARFDNVVVTAFR